MDERVLGEKNFNGGESFGGAQLQWRRKFRGSTSSMEERALGERVFVVVKGNSENMNDRGVWIQK